MVVYPCSLLERVRKTTKTLRHDSRSSIRAWNCEQLCTDLERHCNVIVRRYGVLHDYYD
jgi:hypothetical protein